MQLPEVKQEETPQGKRSIRWNVYGNWVGYVSGKRWKEFGCQAWSEREANEWVQEGAAQCMK